MRRRFTDLIRVGVVALIASPVLFAQTPAPRLAGAGGPGARTARATPDLSGIWMRAETARSFNPKEEPPMQPWAEALYKALREGVRDPTESYIDPPLPRSWGRGRDDKDPLVLCAPPGPTRILMLPRPFEIVQQPGRVLLLFEWDHFTRQIFTDGRGHPDGFIRSWMGHSIGHWDGDTLVVDTSDLNANTWVDGLGHPQTEAMHLVERYRRVEPDTLALDVTFDDPKAYTQPWSGHYIFQRMPKREIAEHLVCEDRLEVPSVPIR